MQALGPSVLRYLRSTLRDDNDASDAFSDFAERLCKSLGAFRGECSLKTWSFRLAVHAAVNLRDEAWRRRVRRLQTEEASALAASVLASTPIRREREFDRLETLRRALSHEEQSLLSLRIDQRLSWEEIAEVLAEDGRAPTPAALSKRFERLKARLARMAVEAGLVEK